MRARLFDRFREVASIHVTQAIGEASTSEKRPIQLLDASEERRKGGMKGREKGKKNVNDDFLRRFRNDQTRIHEIRALFNTDHFDSVFFQRNCNERFRGEGVAGDE